MIQLDEESFYLCTFATPFGTFRFKRLPFEVKCGPEIFQAAMEQVFKKLTYISPFQDDILICGKDEEEHAKHLNEALQQARRNNVKLNINKAKIAMTELKFLGHAISGDKVKPDPEKVKAM